MRKTIAGNIAKYRKQLGMTQIDLSEKINYSDKSISKWERGDGIPDEPESDAKSVDSTYGRFRWKHFFITLLSVAGVWLVAFLLICLFQYLAPSVADLWDGRVLCYALAGSFVVFLIFASLWWERAWIFIAITGIIWAGALSVFVTFHTISGAAVVFALAGVLELPVVLCYFWRCAAKHQWLIPYPFPRKK